MARKREGGGRQRERERERKMNKPRQILENHKVTYISFVVIKTQG